MDRTPGDPSTLRANARVGSVLCGKWRVDGVLGVGGTAAVYAATHRNGNRVAIKVLDATLVHEADICARFRNEGYAVNRIQHPGVVRVLDDDVTEDGCFFLVMDLLVGRSLQDHILAKTELDVDEALFITDQVLSVLRAAHALHILHRDIKPANIFLTRDGSVKVLDFGIARIRGLVSEELGSGATAAGQVMGTPAYMSPEQARGRWDEVDVPSDLWSVGATLFTMLTGRQPRSAESPNEELLLAMTAPISALAGHRDNIDSALVSFVEQSVEMDRARRFQSAEEMQVALRALSGGVIPGVRFGLDEDLPSLPPLAMNPSEFQTTEETVLAPVPIPDAGPTTPDCNAESMPALRDSAPIAVRGAIPVTYRSREDIAPSPTTGSEDVSPAVPLARSNGSSGQPERHVAPARRLMLLGAGSAIFAAVLYRIVATGGPAPTTNRVIQSLEPPVPAKGAPEVPSTSEATIRNSAAVPPASVLSDSVVPRPTASPARNMRMGRPKPSAPEDSVSADRELFREVRPQQAPHLEPSSDGLLFRK